MDSIPRSVGSLALGLLVLCLSALLLTPAGFAQEVEEPTGANQAPVPRAFGQPGSVQLAPGSGSVSDALPLSVPRARRGFEPRLSLSYSSAAGLGDLGRGWSLGGIGHVEYYRGNGYLENFRHLACATTSTAAAGRPARIQCHRRARS